MEMIETETKTIEKNIHHFYCDTCNKYLGSTEEYEDGYYDEIGECEISFYLDNEWYKLNKYLCDYCRSKLISDIKTFLEETGFNKNTY